MEVFDQAKEMGLHWKIVTRTKASMFAVQKAIMSQQRRRKDFLGKTRK